MSEKISITFDVDGSGPHDIEVVHEHGDGTRELLLSCRATDEGAARVFRERIVEAVYQMMLEGAA